MPWEISFLNYVQANLRTDWLTPVMKFFTSIGDNGYLWIGMILVMFCFRKSRKESFYMAAALLLEFILCNLFLKPLFFRVRPYTVGPAILLLEAPADGSFPSGHTGSAFACIAALFLCRSRWRWPSLAVGLVIAWSRLYFYFHFPTDVLGGVILGVAAAYAGTFLAVRFAGKSPAVLRFLALSEDEPAPGSIQI